VDANGTVPVDVNRIDVDANIVAMPNAPPELEGVINFQVVDKHSGEPISDAEVAIKIQREGPDEESKLTTNSSGLVVIEVGDLTTKRVEVEVSKEKYVSMQVIFRREGDLIEVPGRYTFALELGTSIGGYVQNEQGEAIASAKVSFHIRMVNKAGEEPQPNLGDKEVVTDANGFWRFDGLPGSFDDLYFRLSHADYVDDESYGTTPAPPLEKLRDMTAIMVMENGILVSGSVVDSAKKSIANAKVSQGESRYAHGSSTKTDPEGRFEFTHARSGMMVLTVQAEGYAPELKEVSVYDGMGAVDFQLGPARTIRGRVVDPDGNPLSDVGVTADDWRGYRSIEWSSKTNSNGYFEWNEAPADDVMFDFYKQDYMSVRQMAMSAGIDEYVIEMYPSLKVSGTVVDADSNEPIKDFKFTTGIKWDTSPNVHWQTRNGGKSTDGRYEHMFSYPYDGHLIRIDAEGYLPGVSRVFYNDEGTVVFDFRLSRGEGFSGVVYLPSGEPASNAEVIVCTPSQGIYMQNGRNRQGETVSTMTGADGSFTMVPQNEDFTLVVIHDEGYAEVNEADLADSNEILLASWGRVEGVLRIGSKAGSNESIALYYSRPYSPNEPKINFSYKTVTDANGYFEFERVRPGDASVAREVKLSRRSTTYSHRTSVEVKAGETVSLTIGGMGRPVIGQVTVQADYNEPVNFSSGHSSLMSTGPIRMQPPYPEDFHLMPRQEQFKWILDWQKTDEGKAMIEQNLTPEYPENIMDMTMEEIQAWHKQWQQSDKVKAYMKRIKEVRKDRRRYALKIEPDGTFRVDDVPAGNYQLRINVYDRPMNSYSARRRPETIGSVNHEFEVPDINESVIDEPFDLGSLTLMIKRRLKVGDVAPDLETETFEGKAVRLSDFSGKVVLLHFWQSGHPQSIESLEDLKEVYEAFGKNKRFVIVSVVTGGDVEGARKVAEEHDLKWVQVRANSVGSRQMYENYGMQQVFYTYVIGADGKVLARNPGLGQMMLTVEEALKVD